MPAPGHGGARDLTSRSPCFPLALKIAYLLWLVVWVPTYWVGNGPANFLWFCDLANFGVGAAIFLDSGLLFSSQAAGVFLVQAGWIVDFGSRLLFGRHLIGGTEYMFDDSSSLPLRLLSLFHVAMPVLLLWGVRRLGYDRRGWLLQSALALLVLPASYLFGTPEQNLNWVYKPFGREQDLLAPELYLLITMVGYPFLVFWPTHRVLLWLSRKWSTGARPAATSAAS